MNATTSKQAMPDPTTDTPAIPGFYLIQEGTEGWGVCRVVRDADGLYVVLDDEDTDFGIGDFQGAKWVGPLRRDQI